ncbi:GlsB/YeaQ/YmgE family stress response membrane protein [Streptomyces sp. NPDC005791]|uniref:GlsB/YeaQ/YmgE family stress response membrane protein n=1 Tax=Streptomyces sp. NPDC005791 TaxID=3364732 RepID=UPI0036B230CF
MSMKHPGGLLITTRLGIAGAFTGGRNDFFDLATWGAALGVSLLLLIAYRVLHRHLARPSHKRYHAGPSADRPTAADVPPAPRAPWSHGHVTTSHAPPSAGPPRHRAWSS